MKKFPYLLVFLALLTQSCATIITAFKTTHSTLKRPSDVVVAGPHVVTKPILANLDINMERKTSTFSTTVLIIEGRERARKEAEQKAEFRFLEEHQCDFVLDPYLETEISYKEGDEFFRINVKITGLPVVYKKFTELDSLPRIFTELGNLPDRKLPFMSSLSSKKISSTDYSEFGVIGGLNLNWFNGDESLNVYPNVLNTFSQESKIGGSLGIYGLYRPSSSIGLRSELQVFFRNYNLSRSYTINNVDSRRDEFEYRSSGIDFPVMIDVLFSDNFSVHAGPSLSMVFDESIKKLPNDAFTAGTLIESSELKFIPAINIGLNYDLDRFFVGARYYNQLPVNHSKDRILSGMGVHLGVKF